jgi:hypothetical protein
MLTALFHVATGDLHQMIHSAIDPFGMITVLELEIAVWRKHPMAVFALVKKNPIRQRVEYVPVGFAGGSLRTRRYRRQRAAHVGDALQRAAVAVLEAALVVGASGIPSRHAAASL